jgi:selenocysteine lyase/cysteine desulfurase
MTQLLNEAEAAIKNAVHAGPSGRLIAIGTGATAAIDKLQQIVGVALPPATRMLLTQLMKEHLGEVPHQSYARFLREREPVVFVGPYEHHSNEISWREGLACVQEVDLSPDGGVDLGHLEALLKDPRFQGRLRIGTFSAASNVTGRLTPVHEIARLLHQHGAIACFDYAASAPYVKIDMNPVPGPQGGDPSLDAIFVSPHKFLGGPGSSGILVFNERIYHRDLPPTVSGGGTVDYVGRGSHDYTPRIEMREKAGTPGVLQTLKAGLAFLVKEAVGTERIEERERALLERAIRRWGEHPAIEILGNPDPSKRVAIVSFNLKDPSGSYLHPKFVTRIANDLFGIQSRAGCSCAGPYGHRLLNIDAQTSEHYRAWIQKGFHGLKPGWCRIGFHYIMDDDEADYVIDAVLFLAEYAHRFLSLYEFDLGNGAWIHREEKATGKAFSLQAALCSAASGPTALNPDDRNRRYQEYLRFARELAERLQDDAGEMKLQGEAGDLQYFRLPAASKTPVD